MTPSPPRLLVRLWSWKPEKLLIDAQTEHAERTARGLEPDFSFSVYGRPLKDGETADEALKEICRWVQDTIGYEVRHAAGVTDVEIEGLGCAVRADPAEETQSLMAGTPCHYDVVLGTDLAAVDVAPLVSLFDQRKVSRPCSQ